MYLILHAFSRRNEGDGLLVDLTFEALEAAGIRRKDCTVLALDPDSFGDLDHVVRTPGEPRSILSPKLLGAAWELSASLFGLGQVAALARQARGLIAVGGGYLVADSPVRQAGVMLNHFAQLRAASGSRAPTIYLPQSIGPLDAPVGGMVRHQLQQLDRLYVRDDQTMRELDGPNVRRCADLAVMKLARSFVVRPATDQGPSVIIARDLPKPGDYTNRLLELRALMPAARWAVQADVQGPRSDRAFYRQLGIEDVGSFSSVLGATPPSVAISVRLHGAIAALLAGVPAIHLAYERKGWGAYEDLGLDEFVHDVRNFDPELVARQAHMLSADPARMWDLLESSREKLNREYDALVADLGSLLRP